MTLLGGTGLFIWVGPRGRCPCLRHILRNNCGEGRTTTFLGYTQRWQISIVGHRSAVACPVQSTRNSFFGVLDLAVSARKNDLPPDVCMTSICWVIWQSLWNGSLFILPAAGPCWIKGILSWAWWYTLVISALKRLRCGNCESEASLGYMGSSRSACLGESREVGDMFGTREMARQ